MMLEVQEAEKTRLHDFITYSKFLLMLNLVDARRGPATVCTVLTPEPWLLNLGLTLLPHGEPLGEKLKSPEYLLDV
jgi:hypothetical protein